MKTNIKLKGVIQNGEPVYDRPDIKRMMFEELEGKRFEMLIDKEHVNKTYEQLAYYFGGIIAGTCMRSSYFEGYSKTEIDITLRKALRSYVVIKTDHEGKKIVSNMYDDIASYSVDEMSLYIEDVLNLLALIDIHPLSPDEYNLKKYTS